MNPFFQKSADDTPLSQWGESALIAAIGQWLGASAPPPPEGPGDDCAVLPPCKDARLLTTDSVIYGRHFDDSLSGFDAGAKLLKRNASDIAAMGGIPDSAVTAVICGKNLSVKWLEDFCRGMAHAAQACGISLVGGDMAQGADDTFSATMALLGHAAQPVLRTGGSPGDLVCVTGELGGSLDGWHYQFSPRLTEGRWLAANAHPVAMMDITDGLAKDLPSALPHTCDALIEPACLPIRASARNGTDGRDWLSHALCDGEDYELLVILPKDTDWPALQRRWQTAFALPLTCIGHLATAIEPAHGKRLRDKATLAPLLGKGFTHFQNP